MLVKEVDGLFAEWPARGEPLAHLSVAELAALRPGGVDAYLPTALEDARFETWVIGGATAAWWSCSNGARPWARGSAVRACYRGCHG